MDIYQSSLLNTKQQALVKVAPCTPVLEVIYLMNQTQASCVLILEQEKLLGIFTKTDLVRSLTAHRELADITIAEFMSQPVVTVSETEAQDLPTVLKRLQQHQINHLPVTNHQGELLGLVTSATILDTLQTCNSFQLLQITELLSQKETRYCTFESRLNDILNSAVTTSIVSFRVFANYDWEYEYQSLGCEAIFGYTSQEIIQNKHLWMSRVHPEDVETVIMPLFADIFAGHTSTVEYRFYHQDGSLRWISATYTSRQDVENNYWVVTGISGDITHQKQTEAAFKASEERWELAIAGTEEAIWDWDITTDQTFRSDRWYELLGYARHELTTRDGEWMKRLHPDDYERVLAEQAAYLQRETDSYSVEYRLRRQDGSYGWFRSRAKAVWDESGNPVRLVGSLGDISESKATAMALQEREAMLRTIGDNLPNGVIYQVVRELNSSDRFTYLSAGIETLMEVTAEDALQDCSLLYHQVIAEDVKRLATAIEESYQHLCVLNIQVQICTPSGQKKWLQVRSTPHRDPNSCVIWDGLIVDITETKNNEDILRKNQALLAESQQVDRLGSWEFDLLTEKITWTQQLFHLFDLDPTQPEPTYQANLELYHPEDREKLDQAVKRSMLTGESYKLLLRKLTTDDAVTYIEGIGHAEFNNQGQAIRLYGTAQDITERIESEEKIRHSEARLATTQKIAHVGSWELDINTSQRSWSTESFEIFGLDPQQPEPTPAEFLEMVHPDDRVVIQSHLTAALAYCSLFSCEYRIIRPDGSIRYLESRAEVVQDRQGKAIKLIGAILDITERKQAELEIMLSRDLREAIFNESADALFLVDTETLLIIDCNQQAVKMFGASSKAELIGIDGQTLRKQRLTPEEMADCLDQINRQGFSSKEIECVTKQGNFFWGNLAVKRILVAGEDINLVRVTDITQQQAAMRDLQQTKQALLEQEQFLRSIYDSVGQAIFVVDVINSDFRYVGLNRTHELLTGLSLQHIYGKTPEQILPADAAAMVRQHYQDCVNAGVTITYEECLPFQGQLTWWITNLTPLRDENSRIYRIVGNGINISDRKRTEQMLELQAVIARNMAEGILLVRASDGVIVYTNPKFDQMFGYDSGELIGQHISIVNYADSPEAATAVHEAIATSLTQKVEITCEVHNVKKNGTPFWCSATICVFEHPEYGAVFVAVQQDITEQKQAGEKIQASLKEKEVLLKEIHHRVKNNLGIVSSLLQMQCRRTQDPQATAILQDSQNRIASIALVHEKLYRSDDLANIDFAQYIPDLTTHLFDSYNVNSNQIQLKTKVENISLDIETAIPCGLIINELVSNALKYAFPANYRGEIQVTLSQITNHDLTLTVRDNGIGLPAEFEQKKSKTLGMTLILGLVKQLRGQLEIHSHQGTEFKISFTAGRV
ncbi:hypothetical protein CLI64_02840 [Nostoc sp. CENA543]|nr:hypothetical protein CLI64_02840 [Nostoc sp. CENA543]